MNDTKGGGEKWIKHYSNKQKILLVGEGDFSFAACLAKAFENDTSNIIATSRDSDQDELEKKYANAKSNLEILEKSNGCVVLHGVDAYTMIKHPVLQNQLFDRIVFNFPHADLVYREHDASQIRLHQDLVQGFFKSAHKMVKEVGEVHVTHKTAYPFSRWNIKELASIADLILLEEVEFNLWDYPGYCNKKGEGHGSNCDMSFPIGLCSTFKFQKL
ncbi:uncharacterized protein At4g26485 [Beta vulgaris subsp. vulgaris]|uniref:uncharacterized protein At4g26485 n=1 Tax=Beta vulgaris subsp. vulgaris TaxID=3555 RepID=UPI0020368339|nr:uncharacterized protein At4g26485 [Beta vulgaris subsp. vulgaris]